MKLECGMYVRTDEKGIGKATYGDGGKYDLNVDAVFYKCHNIKASFNLIDLIEERDIIQLDNNIKYEVGATTFFNHDNIMELCIFDWNGRRTLLKRFMEDNFVQSILTKEQYNANAYIIKE